MTRRTIAALGLLIVAAGLPFLVSNFILSVVTLACAFGILATSINVAGGHSGLIPLGQAGIMACGGYSLGLAATRLGMGHVGQIAFGLGVALLVSIIFGLMVMRTSGIQYLMVTLAQGMIVWGLALRMYPITGGENGLRGIERPPLFDSDVAFFYFALAALLVTLVISWLITHSPLGLALRALQDSEERLNMLGYNTTFVKFYSFVLAGTLAGFAGIVFAYYNRFIAPDASGFLMSGKGVLMVLLGGTGTLIGPVIGALIITFVENFVSGYVMRWPTILGVLFILVVLFARQGLVGVLQSSADSLTRSWSKKRGQAIEKTT